MLTMQAEADITITQDTADPKLLALAKYMGGREVVREVGQAALVFTRSHLLNLMPNKMGWPSQGLYAGAARGTVLSVTGNEARIQIDDANHPGAIKHQYNRGQDGSTFVFATDRLLTIPARPEFYGRRASEFTNLRFVMFASGAKALVIGTGGASRVNFARGTESNRGIGPRSSGMVAYWLKDHVEQDAKPEVLPSDENYMQVIKTAASDLYKLMVEKGGAN